MKLGVVNYKAHSESWFVLHYDKVEVREGLEPGAGSVATIYADEDGATPLTHPETGADGTLRFYVPEGQYNITSKNATNYLCLTVLPGPEEDKIMIGNADDDTWEAVNVTTAISGGSPTFDSLTVTNNITVGGTVDGRDVASDGSKLDGIEANADVTDADNVTAAGAVMDSELAYEAAVKAINQGLATTDIPVFEGLTADGTGNAAPTWVAVKADSGNNFGVRLYDHSGTQYRNALWNDGSDQLIVGNATWSAQQLACVWTVGARLNVDNLRLDGNTLSTTNTNGDLVLAPNGSGMVTTSKDFKAGAVGVGIDPGAAVHVLADTLADGYRAQNSSGNTVRFGFADGTATAEFQFNYIGTGGYNIGFASNGEVYLNPTSSSSIGLFTAAPNTSVPGNGRVVTIVGETGIANGRALAVFGDGGASDYPVQVLDSGGTQVCVVYGDGDIDNTNGTYGTLSDKAAKENIKPAESNWNFIKALDFVRYNLKPDYGGQAGLYGVTSENVRAAGAADLIRTSRHDGLESVNLMGIAMRAVSVVKELQQRVEALEAA